MRRSLPRIATYLAIAFSMIAVSFTGCQTGSSFKMPGYDWISSWGKKKPPKSALSSTRPDTKLPAPPSTTTTPYQPPGYAQGSGARSGYGASGWGGAQQGSPAATSAQQGYGTWPNSGYYSNATHNTGSGYRTNYDSAPTNPGYASGGADTSRGFYSPNYSPGSARPTTPGLRTTGPSSYADGYGSDTYNSRAPNTYRADSNPRPTSPPWTDGAQSAGQYAGPARTQYDPRTDRDQTTQSTPAFGRDSYNPTGGSGYHDRAPSTLGGTSSGEYSSPGSQQQYSKGATPGASSNTRGVAPGTIAEAYRPGSTSRSTQFGDSRNIDVGSARGIQPAWFGDAGDGTARSSVGDGAGGRPVAGSSARTAAEPYPYTSPSTYR
jgi:hypothetical protein